MKKLVVVIVVLAVILLLAPLGVGKIAESRMNGGLDEMAEQMKFLVVVDRQWSGGWFKSRQEVTFELAPAIAEAVNAARPGGVSGEDSAETAAADSTAEGGVEGAGDPATEESPPAETVPPVDAPATKPVRFKVFNDVLHGPVLGLSGLGIARVDTTLDLSEEIQTEIRKIFGPEPAMEIRTRVGFLGGATTTFTSKGRTITNPAKDDDAQVSYEDFRLAIGYGRNFDTYDIDGRLPKFEIKEKDGGLVVLNSLTFDGDGKRVMGQLYDGEIGLRIEEIKVENPAKSQNLSVEDVHYVVDTRIKDGFASMSAKLGSGALTSAELVATTGIEINEIHYDFSLRRLHAQSLDNITQSMQQSYMGAITKDPGFAAQYLEALTENGKEILKHDPELSLDRIGFVTPEGEGVIKGLIKFVGVTPEDFASPGAMGIVGKLDADLTVEVAVKLAEKIPNGATMAGAAVDSGYAKRDGEKYVCHIVFKNGELTVNGKPQAIPGLGGPPADAQGHPGEMPEEGMPEE